MTPGGWTGTLVFAVLTVLAALIAAHATYTADLSAFLPRAPTADQRLLTEELRAGLASRLIMVAVEGADAPARATVAADLARRLRADPAFVQVNDGELEELAPTADFLLRHRYQLSDAVTGHFSATGLHTAIADTLDLLTSPEALLVKRVFTRDPTGETFHILDELGGPRIATVDGVWSSRDGRRALLIAQTRAAGSDTDGQERASAAIRKAFAAAAATVPRGRAPVALRLSGAGVFAVTSRALIKAQVLRLSALSAVLIAALLLIAYRSPAALLLTFVPVASGALAGVAAVSLGFGTVHGITLGFGVTLIGEAVDYAIYLFTQTQWQQSAWPTIRLGMLTSICGFAALVPSGFPGLAQLQRARMALVLVALAAALLLLAHRNALFSRELSDLSPVPLADQDLDASLRADLGAPDARYLVVVSSVDTASALAGAEAIALRLRALSAAGVIGGFESPTRYLPSPATQRARQASLPAPAELALRLQQALAGLPVSARRLEPFLEDVEAARNAPVLTARDLAGTPLGSAVDALLTVNEGTATAFLPLSSPSGGDLSPAAIAAIRAAVAHAPQPVSGPPLFARMLDLKAEADDLYTHYLGQAVSLSLAGLGAILILLIIARSPARALRIVAPLALAVLVVAAALNAVGQPLGILHVVGMLLIVAVGSNYALFFDRLAQHQNAEVSRTLASLAVANLATVTGFGVLAFSSVPVLAALGRTTAPGALLALLFSALLAPRAAFASAATAASS